MKKSLIAMALMFGAVVFVSSCGGDDDDPTCKNCTIRVTGGKDGGSLESSVYKDGSFCDAELTAIEGKQNGNVEGADAADGAGTKGGKYVVDCK